MTGNKGEWSEIYVLLKLLAPGKFNTTDSDLNIAINLLKYIKKKMSII